MPYDHAKYWWELIRVCKERREAQLERFRALGPRVGMEEREWKSSARENQTNGSEPLQDFVMVEKVGHGLQTQQESEVTA